MKIITKYLLKAFIGPLIMCFVSFNAIFIVFDLFGQVSKFIDMDVGLMSILKYYGGVLSMYSHWFIPASCMLAALYTMWQLSRHSELTALRASGVSFVKLTLPFLFIALCAGAATLLNSELIAPTASTWSDQFKDNAFAGAANTRTRTNLRYVDPVSDNRWLFASADVSSPSAMSRPSGRVEVRRDIDGANVWIVSAERAEYLDGVWWFWNPKEHSFTIDHMGGGAPESAATKTAATATTPNASHILPTPMFALKETPRDIVLVQREWDFLSIADMRRHLRTRKIDDPKKWYEYYYRLAAPWSCVVITIFAIPAGISTGRQSAIKGVILALASFFGFYALTFTLKFICPPMMAALLPNLIFLTIGIFSYKRLV